MEPSAKRMSDAAIPNPEDSAAQTGKAKADLPERHSHVRFTEKEYLEIQEDANVLGETIPTLLKDGYFNREKRRPTFSRDGEKRVLVALAQIGNNLNQIARRVNSGLQEGWNTTLVRLLDEVATLRAFIGGSRGNH